MNKQLSMDDTLLSGTNAPFIEGLFEAYRQNPDSVPPEWHGYFDRLQQAAVRAVAGGRDGPGQIERDIARGAGPGRPAISAVGIAAAAADGLADDPDRIIALGHHIANLGIADVAAGAADGLQQRPVRTVAKRDDQTLTDVQGNPINADTSPGKVRIRLVNFQGH